MSILQELQALANRSTSLNYIHRLAIALCGVSLSATSAFQASYGPFEHWMFIGLALGCTMTCVVTIAMAVKSLALRI